MDVSIRQCIRNIFGNEIQIEERMPVSGGDINQAYRLRLSDGSSVFLKTNRPDLEDMFRAEKEGLSALSASGVIPVVQPLFVGRDPEEEVSYLLLEHIPSGRQNKDFWEDFGRSLALLHRQDTDAFTHGGRFGFTRNNYIGKTPQSNTPHSSFISFFRKERLVPQIRMAERWFERKDYSAIERLLDGLDDLLIEPAFPSLLHGDLWGGNFLVNAEGRAVLIDPAAYVGCAEAELAMTELFGGFSARFYDGYREITSVAYGYEDRRDLYNLYHLLNHLNLFGSGYLPSVLQIIHRYA